MTNVERGKARSGVALILSGVFPADSLEHNLAPDHDRSEDQQRLPLATF